jgi:hypothetical protein
MRKAKVNTWTGNEDVELPLYFEDPKLKDLPPLQRVHRKKNPQLWSDILKKYGGDLNLPNDPSKLRWSENKWRNLLEELYTDKRYFDYMTSKFKFIVIYCSPILWVLWYRVFICSFSQFSPALIKKTNNNNHGTIES